MSKWYKSCAFCSFNGLEDESHPLFQGHDHEVLCPWRKILRAAKWASNGIAVVLKGKSNANR